MHKGLGKGLDALIPVNEKISVRGATEEIVKIPIDKIRPNKYQARTKFDENKLKQLAESIKEKGVIQPVIVSPSVIPGEYELIAGERRLRAAKLANLEQIPVIIRNVNETERYQISLIENLHRDDLNPIEEAKAYQNFINEFNLTQEELAKIISKDRSVIANTLRLLTLPEYIQDLISQNIISPGHGRALVGINDESKQQEIVKRIIKEKLTVRDIEKIVQDWKTITQKGIRKKSKRIPEIINLENELQSLLELKVQLIPHGNKKGKVVIYYNSLDEFDKLLNLLRTKKQKR